MQTIKKKLSELKHPELNVRLHGDRQIKEFVRSIEMFGQIRPLVIDEDGTVLAGNGLMLALETMGRETADCYLVKDLSENQKKKLMLVDNKIFDLGVNSTEAFDKILQDLDGDIDIPGYDEELLKALIADTKEAAEIIDDYGKFSDDRKEELGAKAAPPEQTTAEQQEAQEAQEGGEGAPGEAGGTNTPGATENAPQEAGEPQESGEENGRQYIVCPNCGEKIWV